MKYVITELLGSDGNISDQHRRVFGATGSECISIIFTFSYQQGGATTKTPSLHVDIVGGARVKILGEYCGKTKQKYAVKILSKSSTSIVKSLLQEKVDTVPQY